MHKWLMLLAGGACGTAGRYLLSGAVHQWIGDDFPFGTLAVNTLGCLVIGLLSAWGEHQGFSPEARLFWMVGLLGAFTTFSTLVYDSWRLLEGGEVWLAGANLVGSLLLGLAALWVGHRMASLL